VILDVVQWCVSSYHASSPSPYEHGQQVCRACFGDAGLGWNSEQTQEFAAGRRRWRLRANPGYWGSSAPEVLVLGFSKGPNQDKKIAAGAAFEDVPFAGMRGDLRRLLAAVGLVGPDEDMDSLFFSTERRFGFASLVRCSVAIWARNSKKEFDWIGTGGNIIGQTVMAEPAFVTTCIARHLAAGLPASVKLMVLLGSAEKNVLSIMRALGGEPICPGAGTHYAYRALGCTVIHLPHPAGGNRDSIKAFCNGASDNQRDAGTLECRRQVLPAVVAALSDGTERRGS
jgi:hypothetical protein